MALAHEPASSPAALRRRLRLHVYDESGTVPAGIAIYSLADPRAVRVTRYVGQTARPLTRLMQHVRTARLALPDEVPWWVRTPQLRPLYGWIRELHAREGRLPVMLVHAWVAAEQAHHAERERIRTALEQQLPLLNLAICQMPPGAGAGERDGFV
jgi:hypothetical protein